MKYLFFSSESSDQNLLSPFQDGFWKMNHKQVKEGYLNVEPFGAVSDGSGITLVTAGEVLALVP